MANSSLLVVTPAQLPLESPAGYVLRLSEANGYQTPRYLSRICGLPRMPLAGLHLDMAPLTELVGAHGKTLHGYLPSGGGDPVLCGNSVQVRDIEAVSGRMCPHCVNELGFRPGWMDLAVVDACPYHRIPLKSACTACGKMLTWARPGLLVCKCSANLYETALGPEGEIDDAHATLLDAFIQEFNGNQGAMAAISLGDLSLSLTLRDWLELIYCIGRTHAICVGPERSMVSDMRRASRVLISFREQMSELLVRAAPQMPASGGIKYLTHFKPDIAAIWNSSMRAAVLGVMYRSTQDLPLESYAPALKIELEPWTEDWKTGLAEIKKVPQQRTVQGYRLGTHRRVVAKAAKLPLVAMQRLKARGLLSEVRASRADMHHPEDAKLLIAKFVAIAVRSTGTEGPLVNLLSSVRRGKFGAKEGKGDLLAEILAGKIPVFFERKRDIQSLTIRASDLTAAKNSCMSEKYGGSIGVAAAAAELSCAKATINSLVRLGHLEGAQTPSGMRVTSSSLEQFKAKYVALTTLSASAGTRGGHCATVAASAGMTLLRAPRGAGYQLFAETKDAPELERLLCAAVATKRSMVSTWVYQNPSCPEQTWLGRGARPKWLIDYIAQGRHLSEFIAAPKAVKTDSVVKTLKVSAHVFRNPKNPKQTWTGRGRHPDWLRELIQAGHEVEEFAISRVKPDSR